MLRILSWRDYRHFSRRKEGTRSSAVAASSPPLKSLASKSKASAAVVSDTLCFGTNCIRSSHQRCFSPQVLQCLPKKYLPNVPRASVGPEFVEIYLRRESKRGGDERRRGELVNLSDRQITDSLGPFTPTSGQPAARGWWAQSTLYLYDEGEKFSICHHVQRGVCTFYIRKYEVRRETSNI